MNSEITNNRLDELDGLRGLLALWVVVSHILCWCGFSVMHGHQQLRWFWEQFAFAAPAVEVFIILSGFAISFLIERKRQSYSGFMKGRFFRIYPTYMVCLLFGGLTTFLTPYVLHNAIWGSDEYLRAVNAVSLSEKQHFLSHVLAHLTLLNGVIPHKILAYASGTLLAPAWSITLEWQFYLVAPYVAGLLRTPARLVLFSVVAGILGKSLGDHPALLLSQLPLFLIGIGSYHFYKFYKDSHETARFNISWLVAIFLSFSLIVMWHSIALIIWALAFGCCFAMAGCRFSSMLFGMRNLLLLPSLQWIGRLSYPLYLVHWPLIICMLVILLYLKPDVSAKAAALLMFAVGLPIIVLFAQVLHLFVEKPGMVFGKQLSKPGDR